MTMTGNEDLERKDDHLPKAAALLLVETGIEVDTNADGLVEVDFDPSDPTPGALRALNPFQARLLSDALLEAASKAEGNGLKGGRD